MELLFFGGPGRHDLPVALQRSIWPMSKSKKSKQEKPSQPSAAPAPPPGNGNGNGAHIVLEADAPASPARVVKPTQVELPIHRRVDTGFLQYASYVIRDRAIPNLADGLKPVQRRILWSLHEKDDGRFIKVNSVMGHCMQFHPHGDASIGDALVVLANKRYLIERQGNFGNIYTGDPPAAPRYIECRLTELARAELFNDEITEFVPSYDGRNREPVALPCKLPLTLMLGAEGIAVGLAAKILPHNFPELIEAQTPASARRFQSCSADCSL